MVGSVRAGRRLLVAALVLGAASGACAYLTLVDVLDDPASLPTALIMSPDGTRLYGALAG
jgi:hypothetical protein